jgi:hypothetical protein
MVRWQGMGEGLMNIERVRVITDKYCNPLNDGGSFHCVYMRGNVPAPGRMSTFIPTATCRRHDQCLPLEVDDRVRAIRRPECVDAGFDCWVEIRGNNEVE